MTARVRQAGARVGFCALVACVALASGAAPAEAQGLRVAAGTTTLSGDGYTSTQMGTSWTVGFMSGRDVGFGMDATLAEIEVLDEPEKLISGAVDVIIELRPHSAFYVDMRWGVERQVHAASSGRSLFDGWPAGGGVGYRERLGESPLAIDVQILGLYFSALSGSLGGQEISGVDRSGTRVAARLGIFLGR